MTKGVGTAMSLLLFASAAFSQVKNVGPIEVNPVKVDPVKVKPVKVEPIPSVAGIVDQRDYPDSRNGCGPASMLNLLKFSGPEYLRAYQSILGPDEGIRMRFLVDRYLKNRPSDVYPNQSRWGFHGVQSADLIAGLNEFLKDNKIAPLKGTYLDRKESESAANHLVRCHDLISASLQNGVSPILSLRSYVVQRREENGKQPAWETGYHHNTVVTRVSTPLSATGFELEVLDPYRGKKTNIYIHLESNGQPFRALKGIHENGNWLSGKPFLLVLAPDLPTLRPKDVTWENRFIVVANFLIGAF